jgi:hypothetical protein
MFEGYVGQMYLMMFIVGGVILAAIVGISIWIGRWIEKRKNKGGD